MQLAHLRAAYLQHASAAAGLRQAQGLRLLPRRRRCGDHRARHAARHLVLAPLVAQDPNEMSVGFARQEHTCLGDAACCAGGGAAASFERGDAAPAARGAAPPSCCLATAIDMRRKGGERSGENNVRSSGPATRPGGPNTTPSSPASFSRARFERTPRPAALAFACGCASAAAAPAEARGRRLITRTRNFAGEFLLAYKAAGGLRDRRDGCARTSRRATTA